MMNCQTYRPRQTALTLFLVLTVALEMILSFPDKAYAYTDPNLGNLVFQILFPIITVISTGYLLCKNYLKKKFISLKNRIKERRLKQ